MLITTTPNVEVKQIVKYIAPVFGEVIVGINVLKDVAAGLSNIFGGRSGTYENELAEARQKALAEMEERAAMMGANAIIGMDIDFEVLGANNGMLMVSVSGTAVVTA